MFSTRTMMALLAVLALSAQTAESDIAASKECTAADVGKGFCFTCTTKSQCVNAGSPPELMEDCTVPGEACTVLVGIATCKPIDETNCSCKYVAQCDAYNPNAVLICLDDNYIISELCPDTEGCVGSACTAVTTTPSPDVLCKDAPDGFTLITPLCTTAAYCNGGKFVRYRTCPQGNYFDIDVQGCVLLPPTPCAGCGTGSCPDKSDCSKWYICDGGRVLDEETCNAATPVFDIDSKKCVASGRGKCTGNANCTYDLTTSAPTSTTPVSSFTTTTVSTSTTTPVPTSTTTPVSTFTTTPVSTSTTAPVSTSTTTPVSTSTTTPVSTSTTTPVSSSTTTTSRPATCTAANVGQRYPYAGNCKKYWSCRLVATGVYAYVESTCMGDFVFNAATGYCDTLANVPSCVLAK